MKRGVAITLLCCLAGLAGGCSAAHQQPFDARRCARTCIEMADSCKASCMRMTDPTGAYSGSRDSCERTCQTQRDTCDMQCMQGHEP